ncbi:MAG: hypothetical protein ACREBN_02310 [Burkholderiaceae bacterium]
MKRPERKAPPRGGPTTGSRTGPRARAAQDQWFSDPYKRGERPDRPVRDDGPRAPRLRSAPMGGGGGGGGGAIVLDPDVARAFRTSEAVNEALRLVIRLARVAGGGGGAARPAPFRDRPAGERTSVGRFSRDDRAAAPARRGPRANPKD